jgi:hypothetical protein
MSSIRGLAQDDSGRLYLQEVEVSITTACTLRCAQCGFLVPEQPLPSLGETIIELTEGLSVLVDLGISIRSLAILGGEPTLAPRLLTRACREFSALKHVGRIEVVSNGLSPSGLELACLEFIDRFTLSAYTEDHRLADRWRQWLLAAAPAIELVVRRPDEWDQWTGNTEVSPEQAQDIFQRCWYRKHCVTLERGRLFICSRIAKGVADEEGLPLIRGQTGAEDVANYLNSPLHKPSCRRCIPMMGLPRVAPGVQPDDRIARLTDRAIEVLQRRIHEGKGGEASTGP